MNHIKLLDKTIVHELENQPVANAFVTLCQRRYSKRVKKFKKNYYSSSYRVSIQDMTGNCFACYTGFDLDAAIAEYNKDSDFPPKKKDPWEIDPMYGYSHFCRRIAQYLDSANVNYRTGGRKLMNTGWYV